MHALDINWLGVATLYKREVWRFLKVFNQTMLAPVVTSLLFLAVFALALGGATHTVAGLPFGVFIAPGLIMMAVTQNAFANTSSSLMLSKIQGVIVDLLMPPFTPGEITFCLAMGGVTRGLCVGLAVTLSLLPFVPLGIHDPVLFVFHLFAASLMMALVGILTGIWAQTFDQLAAITNYIITPLAFLSGTFYSVANLPKAWWIASHLDPMFYMIDGFRYAMTGHHDGSVTLGVWVMVAVNVVLWAVTRWMLAKGYRLKS